MFFVLKFSTPQGTPESFNVFPPAPFGLFLGRPLPRSFRLVTIIMDKLKGIPDIWTNGPYVILATRVIEVMRNLGETHFEDFPLALVSRKGETEANSFRVINLLDNVACRNKEASEYRLNDDDFIKDIRRLVLHEDRIPRNRHLFRLHDKEDAILASEPLVHELSSMKASGAKFIRIDEIADWF